MQQDEADSECSGSVASRATGRGQQLYERGMEMKLRQEQIRKQLIQVFQLMSSQQLQATAVIVTECHTVCA